MRRGDGASTRQMAPKHIRNGSVLVRLVQISSVAVNLILLSFFLTKIFFNFLL
uniref:Uncharacterized protein n=1 Tax=Anguilla anguilla TaxID=7936 RepID=A0A0E9U8R9_ANGAN